MIKHMTLVETCWNLIHWLINSSGFHTKPPYHTFLANPLIVINPPKTFHQEPCLVCACFYSHADEAYILESPSEKWFFLVVQPIFLLLAIWCNLLFCCWSNSIELPFLLSKNIFLNGFSGSWKSNGWINVGFPPMSSTAASWEIL